MSNENMRAEEEPEGMISMAREIVELQARTRAMLQELVDGPQTADAAIKEPPASKLDDLHELLASALSSGTAIVVLAHRIDKSF